MRKQEKVRDNMTESEAVEMLRAYRKCQRLQVKGIYEDCNEKLCENCELCYAQGNAGEHIKSVDIAIQALEKQMHTKPIVDNWVSCDERLPDDVNKYYLVTYRDVILGNFEYGVCISYFSNFSDGNKSWEIEEEHENNLVVTAWMDLPDAYLPNNKELKDGGPSE